MIENFDESRRSSSPKIIDEQFRQGSTVFSLCCPSTRRQQQRNNRVDGQQGFLNRIQNFKAQKRRSSMREKQLSPILNVSNGHLSTIEIDRLPNSHDDDQNECFLKNSSQLDHFNDVDYFRCWTKNLDSFSFNDIEVSSSNCVTEASDEQFGKPRSTSFISKSNSSPTTDLSAYSTQSLLRRLIDKAQILDQYYNEIYKKKNNQSTLSLTSSSSNSGLGRSPSLSCSVSSHRNRSKTRSSLSKRHRLCNENVSSDGSRYDLYNDEDNVLRELIRFNNDIDLILSRLEMDGDNLQVAANVDQQSEMLPVQQVTDDNQPQLSFVNDEQPSQHIEHHCSTSIIEKETRSSNPQTAITETFDKPEETEIFTMRTNLNEINVHLLSADSVDKIREAALRNLLKIIDEQNDLEHVDEYETLSLTKLNKLPKSPTWKGKRVFGVPLRIYQQSTGHVLPLAISNALQYVRLHAGKCEGLFRKPGVKSKIDRLRAQIEQDSNSNKIRFDEFQPFVVADVIRQYFRELPECLIAPILTRLICDLLKRIDQEEQILVIRFIFLILPDENREVLESLLRFLLDVSIRSGNSQTTCRSLARIFLPSIFQSYYDVHSSSTKILWWKRKKDKADGIQQENDRLLLEQCLMTMIVNVDLLCRVPMFLSNEIEISLNKKPKRLDELVRNVCHGEFHLKKFISSEAEEFLKKLNVVKFRNVPSSVEGVTLSMHKGPIDSNESTLPIWKSSVDVPCRNLKEIYRKLVDERFLWEENFAESRVVEQIDEDKQIVQYVLNFLDSVPVRSFCEFRFMKKIYSRSTNDVDMILIGALSIDHLQNHFLPGSIGRTHRLFFYVTPSATDNSSMTVTQYVSVDFNGRSTFWYENVFGHLIARNLQRFKQTFTNNKIIRV